MKKKKKGSLLPVILIFLAGLSLLLYPTVSNFANSLHSTQAIADYTQGLQQLDREQYRALWDSARAYNQMLQTRENEGVLPKEFEEDYKNQLNVMGSGIMAYIEIPSISVRLPIYHGTDEGVLQVAIGHLEWSSLPVGGENTHCVISGHRGLPSAELLTHIDRMKVGDAFYIHVLDKVLEYRVDDIAVVLPEDTSRLQVSAGKDYLTLVTCTPYGVNSHRLLVRGIRAGEGMALSSTGQLLLTDELRPVSLVYVIPVVLLPVLGLAAAAIWLRNLIRTKKEENHEEPSNETTS